jgi:hypothetical protein
MWSTAAGSVYSRRVIAFDKGEIGVQPLELDERRLRLIHPAELREAGNHITQASRPVAVERPGTPPGFDGLGIMAQQVMRAGQGGEPDEQPRIGGAEARPRRV